MNWSKAVRTVMSEKLTWERLIPSEQPVYVSSLVYSFGVFTLSSFVFCIASGVIMSAKGPLWYQVSPLGGFMRSMHFWSVQAFFFFMTMHLVGQFFMGSWREGRAITWLIGALSFAVSVLEAFTGYLSRGDFFAQWNQVQSKDAFNGAGLDGFLNILNNGQVYGLHIVVLPLLLTGLIGWHLLAVRSKGVVPPFTARSDARKEMEEHVD